MPECAKAPTGQNRQRSREGYKCYVTGSLGHDQKLIEILYFQMPSYLAQ